MNTLINVINNASNTYGDKTAFTDATNSFSFAETVSAARGIATQIISMGIYAKPITLYMPRSAKVCVAMAGVPLSGNFYTVLDVESPVERQNKIVNTLKSSLIICLGESVEFCKTNFSGYDVLGFEQLIATAPSATNLSRVASMVCPSDTAFTIFTSGSTGTPKGTIITHKNVLAYINWFITRFNIDSKISFGSQTPFFFSMSVTDLFSAWLTGASYHIIPKSYFAFPAKLIEYINSKRVNTIYWVPTALEIAARFDLLGYQQPEFLKMVFFAGEVMPVKTLNYWIKNYPLATYTNLFGPTETTDICAYYVVNRDFKEDENLPIGLACEGAELFVIDDDSKLVGSTKAKGELYVGGDFVASGYFNEPEKTAAAFVPNPLNASQTVYKTGDLVMYNEYGELMYLGRRDSQIKYKGYRIELGEIETLINSIDGVARSVCLFDSTNEEIILLYEGDSSSASQIALAASTRLPSYMVPQKYIALDGFPINANGKIDRALLKKTYL